MKLLILALSAFLTAAQTSPPCDLTVTGFKMVDPVTGDILGNFATVMDYASLPATVVNVMATTDSCVQSIKYVYEGVEICDSTAPFYATSSPITLAPGGPYRITATAYSGPDCTGTAGPVKGRRVTITDEVCPGKVVGFSLWDAKNNTKIRSLPDGGVFCSTLALRNIEAETVFCSGGALRSAYFELTGPKSLNRTENFVPFMLVGDNKDTGDIFGTQFPVGTYTISATPYSRRNLFGAEGGGMTISFTVKAC